MKHVTSIIVNGSVFCVLWITSALLTNSLLQVEIPTADNASLALLLMWICCMAEAAALHIYLLHNQLSKGYRLVMVFVTIFLIQFVFTQVESVYYIDTQLLPSKDYSI